jgi:hypothetical protein
MAAPANRGFHLTQLFFWSSEMTPQQVLEEFQGNALLTF